jgi:hypothetical protein
MVKMSKPLEYYFENGTHVIFNKYTIENGVIKNVKGESMAYNQNTKKYNRCGVIGDNGKQRNIYVGRAIASSFLGPPPSPEYTADHIDRNPENDTNTNIRWATRSEQNVNQDRSETLKTVHIVIKDGVEKTLKEWVEHLKDEKNPFDRGYTNSMIKYYAQTKQFGFSYKEYPDLSNETWREIIDSKNNQGYWEISDMNRMKYVTKFADNILSGNRFRLNSSGYPIIKINGKQWSCHILSFMTFFPEEYANKNPDELVLHEDDDKMDFRPHKLRLGTQSENSIDAHNNGKYDGKKSMRMRCASYINGVFEKEHESQIDAAKYLKINGHSKADPSKIGLVLSGDRKTAYGRVWKLT